MLSHVQGPRFQFVGTEITKFNTLKMQHLRRIELVISKAVGVFLLLFEFCIPCFPNLVCARK